MRLSPSLAKLVERCNLAARWQRIDKVPTPDRDDPEYFRAGRAIHQALEGVYRDAQAAGWTGPLHTPTWLETSLFHLDHAIEEHGPFDIRRTTSLHHQLIDYLLDQDNFNAGDILGIEQFLQMGLRKGTNVVGFADRIDRNRGGVSIVDYKGGRTRWTTDVIRADLQTQTYAVLAYKRFSWARHIRVQIAALHHRETTSALWTADDLPNLETAVRQRYLDADDLLTEGPWNPTPGDWCKHCEFKPMCPAFDGQPMPGSWNPEIEALQPAEEDR